MAIVATILLIGRGEEKYVGKWVSKEGEILELKPDGTYEWVAPPSFVVAPSKQTGIWEVIKEGGEEWIEFVPPIRRGGYLLGLRKSKRGNMLVTYLGEPWVKQD
jgi:hypothetical protein